MTDERHFQSLAKNAVRNDCGEDDEIPAVLAVLQRLIQQTRHPVVRVCLEQAREDIAYLTSCGEEPPNDDGESAAAA